jgi:hypothetical protein
MLTPLRESARVPMRTPMVAMLRDGELSVCQLASVLVNL